MDLDITEGHMIESFRRVKSGEVRKCVIDTEGEEGKIKVTTYNCGTIIRIDIKEG